MRTLHPKIKTLEGGSAFDPPLKCWIGSRFVTECLIFTDTKTPYSCAKHQKVLGRPAPTRSERTTRFWGRCGDSTIPLAVELSPPVVSTSIPIGSLATQDMNSSDFANSPPSSTRMRIHGYPWRLIMLKNRCTISIGGRLCLQLYTNFILVVASTILNVAMNPLTERTLQKV